MCGDFNGTLSDTLSNWHDMMLKAFMEEQNLNKHPRHGDIQTLIGHSGSTSQIDYVLTKCHGLITQVSIKEKSSLKKSSHVPVLAQLNILKSTINMCVLKSKTKSLHKVNWEKDDIQLYQRELAKLLHNKTESQEALPLLVSALQSASTKSVPNRLIKVKGPKLKLSPVAKQLESECKHVFFMWKQAGSPSPEHPLSIRWKVTKYEVRKQISREFACARDSFYAELKDNPTDK